MTRPIFYLVHDDGELLDRLAADLGRRFGADYDVVGEREPQRALDALRELQASGAEVALVFAAEQLGGGDGAGLLERVRELHPGARRILLVARGRWGAAHPAVQALARGQIDAHVFVPWRPLERWLYLPVSEFLADRSATRPAADAGIQIVGETREARAHALRDTLTRARVPFAFHAADSPGGRRILAESGAEPDALPVLVTRSGRTLVDPTPGDVARLLGFDTRPDGATYDVVIAGSGPAGLSAAVYGASEGLRTLVVEPAVPGGQAGTSSRIRNYLGFPQGVSGQDLATRSLEQAWFFGAQLVLAREAIALRANGEDRVLSLSDGTEVTARAVIVATGVTWRRLGVPALEPLHGAGVFYGAAASEAAAVEGRDVVVVGAGNSAGQAAVHLARHAASVTVAVRGERLGASMSDYLVRELEQTPNVAIRLRTEVVDGRGAGCLTRLTLRDRASGACDEVDAAALFVMIGAEPRTQWLGDSVLRDDQGYVLTGHDLLDGGRPPACWPLERPPLLLESSLPGVFAVGDVRAGSVKRVASAVGAGSIAIGLVHRRLAELGAARAAS